MNVERVEVRPYRLPFVRPYRTASVERTHRTGAVVVVTAEDGTVGLGEAAPLGSRTETHAACIEALVNAMAAMEGRPLEDLVAKADAEVPSLAGAPASRFGVTTALFDLAARLEGLSLARWLADRFTGVKALPESVPVNATIPSATTGETIEHALTMRERGFSTFKLKVGHDKANDAERIAAVREALGPQATLRLDANQGWARDEAARFVDAFAGLGIDYIEQPVVADDLEGLAWLRERGPLRVAADEPIVDAARVERLLALDAADVYVLKPMVLGGADRALALAHRIEAAGHETVVTCTIDGVVARQAALATAAALGERTLACGLATASLLEGDVAPVNERIVAGRMFVGEGAGHGVRL